MKNADKSKDLKIGRMITLGLLLCAMAIAPLIAEMGGIYTFMQTMLSMFQGPMLALLLLGAFTRLATPTAGLWTLISGVAVAAGCYSAGIGMLYVAFISFVYALIALIVLSMLTTQAEHIDFDKVTYAPWRRS